MVKCLRVEKGKAEAKRRELAGKGILDNRYAPARDSKFVFFPVKGAPPGMKLVEKKLARREGRGEPFSAELEAKLTPVERAALVKSFDIVGDIAVVEVPLELEGKEKLIADAIMKQHRGILVVAKKMGGTAGEFRIRPVEVIAGEKRTHTLYREGGCVFGLDLNKTYFSPRLGTERGRLCALVKKGERVLVPFAGVGPFAIRMGKAMEKFQRSFSDVAPRDATKMGGAEVVGLELNPEACAFFRENIERNKCKNVRVVEGDVAALLPGKYNGWADRVAMPLPKDGRQFLAGIIPCLKKGGMLHYYSFGGMEAPFAEAERDVVEASAKLGRKARVVFRRVVRPYSKTVEQVVVDAEIL
ncbi:MAG: class I SAM-dependent methyltransferase family protein [Candidatus Micrarchaeia archaeon]